MKRAPVKRHEILSAIVLPNAAISAIEAVIALGITFVVVRVYQKIVKRFRGRVPIGLVASFQQFGSWIIWILGVIVALSIINVSIDLLLLVAGLGGAALIIAYREVLSVFVASQFLTTYQPIKVGEWVEVDNHYGRVIETDLIETKLLTPNNEIVVIPNSTMMKQTLVNKTRAGTLRVKIPVYAKRGLDLNEVEAHLLEIARGMKVDLASDTVPEVRVAELDSEYSKLELLIEIANPAKRELIVSEVQKRVYELLQELERQLFIRADK